MGGTVSEAVGEKRRRKKDKRTIDTDYALAKKSSCSRPPLRASVGCIRTETLELALPLHVVFPPAEVLRGLCVCRYDWGRVRWICGDVSWREEKEGGKEEDE